MQPIPRYAIGLALSWGLLACAQPIEPPFAQAAALPPVQLGLCAACHLDNGRAGPIGTPRLAGQDAVYLVTAMEAYRSGDRRHPAMRAIVGALSVDEVRAFAAFYAAQPACAPAP